MSGPIVVALSLAFMLMRVVAPYGAKVQGKPVREVVLNYRERMTMQRLNLCALAVILLLGVVGRWIQLPYEILAIVAAYGILMVPVRYRLTTEGIALNRVVFRRWSEFGEMEVSPQRIVLRGRPGNGRLTLWLRDAHQRDVLPLLRRYVQSQSSSRPSTKEKEGDMKAGTMLYRRLLPRRF